MSQIDHSDLTSKLTEHATTLGWELSDWSIQDTWTDGTAEIQLWAKPIPICGEVGTAERPRIVVLCGSTRFSHAFREANLRETLAGRIVLTIGCDMRSDAELFADLSERSVMRIKDELDVLHKRKIDLADEVLVLNVGGYVGDSTRSEIEYAQRHGKPIRWLESEPAAPKLAQGAGERPIDLDDRAPRPGADQ